MKVRVYWNLHKKMWSVQDTKTNKVIGHKQHITLWSAKFVVRKGGQKRVRQRTKGWNGIDDYERGSKNVHAFAEGWYPSTWISPKHYHEEGREVTYNPYKNDTFVYKDTGEPVGQVGQIWLTTTAEGKPSVKVYS